MCRIFEFSKYYEIFILIFFSTDKTETANRAETAAWKWMNIFRKFHTYQITFLKTWQRLKSYTVFFKRNDCLGRIPTVPLCYFGSARQEFNLKHNVYNWWKMSPYFSHCLWSRYPTKMIDHIKRRNYIHSNYRNKNLKTFMCARDRCVVVGST